jgi:hypothetical protein
MHILVSFVLNNIKKKIYKKNWQRGKEFLFYNASFFLLEFCNVIIKNCTFVYDKNHQ